MSLYNKLKQRATEELSKLKNKEINKEKLVENLQMFNQSTKVKKERLQGNIVKAIENREEIKGIVITNLKKHKTIIGIMVINTVLLIALSTTFLRDNKDYILDQNMSIQSDARNQFREITTTEMEYNLLRRAAEKYIEEGDKSPDTIVDTDTIVGEEVYVDALELIQPVKEDGEEPTRSMENILEAGPIYLQDKIIIRYINEDGELKVVASEYVKETNEIHVVSRNNLSGFKRRIENETNENQEGADGEEEQLEEELRADREDDYLESIADVITYLINSEKLKPTREIVDYTTEEGLHSIAGGRTILRKEMKSNYKVTYTDIGKSIPNKEWKDRIYIHLVDSEDGEIQFGVIVKINNDLKIFDIDIV